MLVFNRLNLHSLDFPVLRRFQNPDVLYTPLQKLLRKKRPLPKRGHKKMPLKRPCLLKTRNGGSGHSLLWTLSSAPHGHQTESLY